MKNHEESTEKGEPAATNPAPKPGDYQIGSVESRAAARNMLDEGPFEDSWRHMIAGEGPNGEQVRIHFGENERVLRTELLRNEEWVCVPMGPKLSRITCYNVMVASGKVMLIVGDCPKARELLLENGS
jgi:hypothetical protein